MRFLWYVIPHNVFAMRGLRDLCYMQALGLTSASSPMGVFDKITLCF